MLQVIGVLIVCGYAGYILQKFADEHKKNELAKRQQLQNIQDRLNEYPDEEPFIDPRNYEF